MKVCNKIGKPIELGMSKLPAKAQKVIEKAVKASLERALKAAVFTLNTSENTKPSNWRHRIAVIVTGAVGGAFTWIALPFELPISTVIMLRSIADHARSQGFDITDYKTRMECLSVFALGSDIKPENVNESSYYAVRGALAKLLTEAAEYIAQRAGVEAITEETERLLAPQIVKFIEKIATRYGIVVTEKAASVAIPLIGAAGGAIINTLFINHFQDAAKAHFTIRRLEHKYGGEIVRMVYEKM
ncbi:MAG: EcsC family protein [Planctomycetia bacterium]|jgi:hypothetical protein|uniref:EcsC protein family protein n=1 Tax=Kuenenia stuttgartiensis TaxID=174633 RepID=A0A2C9CKN6_KUEST|nr:MULTISPECIES: EcsC family protein [Kuenenia]MBE7549200.1 EcsC family protein [Planctomycetia bacterium]MCZ7622139.1 EcsC family protein [Candidatus Kuenenia sp.]GJQ51073.1 MAG: hypothetical protein HKUEN01_34590 [Candidatus Kuenenia stuttgartiensis]SOH06158.1 EcsC protein family protein [Candidatus Kuenenia stuttgartiensis]